MMTWLLISLALAQINQAPVWTPLTDMQVMLGHTAQFVAAATDPENNPITYSPVRLPPGANFNPSNQLFSWTPQPGQEGIYQVTLRASDGLAVSDISLNVVAGGNFDPKVSIVYQPEAIAAQNVAGASSPTGAVTNSSGLAASVFTLDKIINPGWLLAAIFVLLLIIVGLLVMLLGRGRR